MNMPAFVLPPPPPAIVQQVASLPTLVRRAATTLANATTAAEVLDAKAQANLAYDAAKAAARFARAKGAYDEVIGAVYRSQADALEIEAMAKRRFADEYDAAQERGEVAKPTEWQQRKDVPNGNGLAKDKLTLHDLGVSRKDVSGFRDIRDAEVEQPGIIKQAIDTVLNRGDEPSKRAVGIEVNARLASFSGDNEWYTPRRYIEMARDVMGGIDCDPASNATAQAVIRATVHYTEATNGLAHDWHGRVWMNPPYSHPEVQQFSERLLAQIAAKHTTEAIVLTNNSGDTAWHQDLQFACSRLCITRGRIKFESGNGRASNSPPVGQTFLYFGPNGDKFEQVFLAISRRIWR